MLGAAEQDNVQGERQKKLDVIANDLIKHSLENMKAVKGICSEEEANPVPCKPRRRVLVMFDLLDGSSNIDVNVTVGTIFPSCKPTPDDDATHDTTYLQTGPKQLAAGCTLYGPSTLLVLSTGAARIFSPFDPRIGEFYLQREGVKIPNHQRICHQHVQPALLAAWHAKLRQRLTARRRRPLGQALQHALDCFHGGRNSSHPDARRHLYVPLRQPRTQQAWQAAFDVRRQPMSMLIEQAGGKASTSKEPIMDVVPGKHSPARIGDYGQRRRSRYRGALPPITGLACRKAHRPQRQTFAAFFATNPARRA